MLKTAKRYIPKEGRPTEDDQEMREYTFLPDGWSADYEHPQALIVRIGQYQQTGDIFTPPPFFVEFETADLTVYDEIRRALPDNIPDPHFQSFRPYEKGDEEDCSYAIEYKIRQSRMATQDLAEFTKTTMQRLSEHGLISENDANLLLRQERQAIVQDDEIIKGVR